MDHSNHSGEQQHYRNVLRFQSSAGESRLRGEVDFCAVSLQDTATGHELLNGISFHVPHGTRVGLVGPHGSGKINLLNLLTGFQGPSAGAILLDGRDLREYKLDELHRQFSVVPHDPMLLASTVAANIAYSVPRASRADVVSAAKSANAHDFITALPHGYEAVLGEGGCALLPGERYRLAIARAFLKNAPMLILDEPALNEDLAGDQLIVDALDSLLAGRTSFTIARRISTLERCDMVLVLNHGSLDAVCTGNDYVRLPRLAWPAAGSVPRSIDMLKPGPVLLRIDDKTVARPRF